MIDFNTAGTQRPEQMNAPDQVEGDPAAAFLSKMAEFNLAPETLVTNGALQRFDVDKKGDKAGWYVYHDGDIPAGALGDLRDGLSITWCSKKVSDLTWEQSQVFKEKQRIVFERKKRLSANLMSRICAQLRATGS